MKVFIASIEYDIDGYIEIDALPESEFGSHTRRANRTQTLDGGVVAQDYGFTHADRTMIIRFKPTEEIDAALKYLIAQYSIVNVSADGGFYRAIPEYVPSTGASSLNLQITETLA